MSEIKSWIKNTIEKLENLKLLNDKDFAKSKALSLFKKGKSSKAINAKLKSLGICDDYIMEAMANLIYNFSDDKSEENLDYKAAQVFAKKKNFFPIEPKVNSNSQKNKIIQSFARAGFSYNTIRKFINFNLTDYDN